MILPINMKAMASATHIRIDIRRTLLLTLLITLFFSPSLPARSGDAASLKARIRQVVGANPALQGGRAGIYVKLLRGGQILYAQNADTPLAPASSLKVLTSAAALDLLGADYRYETRLLGPRPDPAAGIITGSIYLQGSGDPTWLEELMDPPDLVLRDFACQLAAMGVHRIKGDLVADDRAFDREYLGRGWRARYLLEPYAPACGALSLEGNVVRVTAEPGLVSIIPPSLFVTPDTWVTAGESTSVSIDRAPGGNRIRVKGRVREGSCYINYITIEDPALFTTGNLAWHLQRLGITLNGSVRLIRGGESPSAAISRNPLCRFQSLPLFQILTLLNKTSDNFVGQQVLKTLGTQEGEKGSLEAAARQIGHFMDRAGINRHGLVLADGCGLSPLDRITARQLVEILSFMWKSPQGQVFMDTLPAGGEPDTTLKSRLNGLPVRAKTGTIAGCTSLTGYCITAYGQTLAFAILLNDLPGSIWTARQGEDALVKTLVNWKGRL